MNTPKVGTCYCGCGKATSRHFAEGEGDGQALSMLNYLRHGTTNTAAILLAEGYGPGGNNLRKKAEAAGWKPSAER